MPEPFVITFSGFNAGQAPVAHLDSLTELGGAGHYSAAANVDILSKPGRITQGPALADLTNGTQAGVVDQLLNFIMDTPASDGKTYGIGTTKLFQISSTAVSSGGTPSWPVTVTNMTDGESVIEFQGALYSFFNKSSGGDISKFDLASTFDHDWGSTVPTGFAALQKAPHPVAKKEDIMLFGNGRYVGTFISATNTLAPTQLDFGSDAEVADVAFHSNQWWIAVNVGLTTGTNRTSASLYLYDGSAVSSVLFDEVAVGVQQIGCIIPVNGVMFVIWKDISGANIVGFVSGRSVKALGYFSGNLPTFEKKTLYKDVLLFESSGLLYAAGAATPDLPFALSQLADGGYATCGGLAVPFATPMIASTDSGSNHRVAKFSGFDTACTWRSLVIPLVQGRSEAVIDEIIVLTKHLGASASCALKIETNQAQTTSAAMTITTAGKRKHVFTSRDTGLGSMEDFRIFLDWAGGHATNDCLIRSIQVKGHRVAK